MSDDVVEAMARGMWEVGDPHSPYDMIPDFLKSAYRAKARAAIRAVVARGGLVLREMPGEVACDDSLALYAKGRRTGFNAALAAVRAAAVKVDHIPDVSKMVIAEPPHAGGGAMSVVTEEMVRAGLAADTRETNSIGEKMRVILAAVAPLIAAQERERCAKVVETHQDEVQRNIDDNILEVRVVDIVPSDNWPLIKARDWLKHTAAAIRAAMLADDDAGE